MKNIEFLNWFVGFAEGDGSFVLSNKKYFEITQTVQDAQILYYIKKQLGFGTVIKTSTYARYSVYKQEHLEILRSIFETRICTENTKIRYNLFYNTSLSSKSTPSLNNAWLAGFIDAEGCFRIKKENNNTYKLIFEITQKEEEIIISIRNLLKSLKHNVRKDRSVYKLEFSKKEARKTLIKYLKINPLRTQKRIVLKKWIKADTILDQKNSNYKEKLLKINWRIKDIVRSDPRGSAPNTLNIENS